MNHLVFILAAYFFATIGIIILTISIIWRNSVLKSKIALLEAIKLKHQKSQKSYSADIQSTNHE